MSTKARGVTLIELIVFIVIVGVALAGVFAAFNTMTAASANPQVNKQMLAIAESLMDEVALMPFTYCDPDDPAAAAATGIGDCTAPINGEDAVIGPEAGETRYNAATPLDNVSDYHTFSMGPGIQDITSATVGDLSDYSVTITVTQAGLASGGDAIPGAEALRISITVTGPGGVSTTLEGYRTRYAPNSLP